MKLIFETPEGGVAIAVAAPGKDLNAVAAKVVPSGTSYEIVEDSAIPSDRRFRSAWEKDGCDIVVNVSKAKTIGAKYLRQTALELIEKQQDADLLGETVGYTKAHLQAAYQSNLASLYTKTTISQIEYCLDQFVSTYSV
tara:strand:- start:2 stop:418 length:417 start_codon:yes stop_codon:yes gene_type:complete